MNTTNVQTQETTAIQIQENTAIQIQETVRNTRERLEADFCKLGTKIHRFPRGLRPGVEERYIIPSFVSLGPYHHDLVTLRETEEVKHMAAHYFCEKSGHSVEEVYGKILSIVCEARSCYADDAVAKFTDAEFAVMMFLDGCFLLLYPCEQVAECALLSNRMTLSTGPCMLRDIFLLENQLPWLVLEALMGFWILIRCNVYDFIVEVAEDFNIVRHSSTPDSNKRGVSMDELKRYKPPHLLGLLRYYQTGDMTDEDHIDNLTCSTLASSAIELAEVGIKLTASNKPRFADISIQRDSGLFSQLSLTPLFVNDVTACWLVNMAAYEACVSTTSDGFIISSYISLLAMLMDREEDVHELRAKRLLRSFLSNHELLVLFKGFTRHLRLGLRFHVITDKIEKLKRERPVRITVHRFIYNNFRTIVAVLSVASVLVGIFKTLTSLKQHQP